MTSFLCSWLFFVSCTLLLYKGTVVGNWHFLLTWLLYFLAISPPVSYPSFSGCMTTSLSLNVSNIVRSGVLLSSPLWITLNSLDQCDKVPGNIYPFPVFIRCNPFLASVLLVDKSIHGQGSQILLNDTIYTATCSRILFSFLACLFIARIIFLKKKQPVPPDISPLPYVEETG